MHDSTVPPHVDRYIPFKREGWGIALAVVLLAVATAGWAAYVHSSSKAPTDVRFQAAGTSHGAATAAPASH
jgi:hypothetical protein